MNVTYIPSEHPGTHSFPILMEAVGGRLVVLFITETSGVVLKPGDGWNVGELGDDWEEANNRDMWRPYRGEIHLSND